MWDGAFGGDNFLDGAEDRVKNVQAAVGDQYLAVALGGAESRRECARRGDADSRVEYQLPTLVIEDGDAALGVQGGIRHRYSRTADGGERAVRHDDQITVPDAGIIYVGDGGHGGDSIAELDVADFDEAGARTAAQAVLNRIA